MTIVLIDITIFKQTTITFITVHVGNLEDFLFSVFLEPEQVLTYTQYKKLVTFGNIEFPL